MFKEFINTRHRFLESYEQIEAQYFNTEAKPEDADDSKMISNYLSNMSDAQLAPLTLDDQVDPFNPRTASSPTTTNRHSENRRVSADLKLKQTGSD